MSCHGGDSRECKAAGGEVRDCCLGILMRRQAHVVYSELYGGMYSLANSLVLGYTAFPEYH